jgi:hypothetical protein
VIPIKDLSSLAKGVSDSIANGQFGDVQANWGYKDVDPDGGTTFENMDGDASYPHNTSPSNVGHDHYKGGK